MGVGYEDVWDFEGCWIWIYIMKGVFIELFRGMYYCFIFDDINYFKVWFG